MTNAELLRDLEQKRLENAETLDAFAVLFYAVGTMLMSGGAWVAFGWPGVAMIIGGIMVGLGRSWASVAMDMRRDP